MEQNKPRKIDLMVVGLGPAGVACALQAKRDDLMVLAISKESVGGLVRAARRIDNLPTSPSCSGECLAEEMERQLRAWEVPWRIAEVTHVEEDSGEFYVHLKDGSRLISSSLCLATGTLPSVWPGKEVVTQQARIQDIHRDKRSFPANLENRRVVVVGGGEAALDTALSAHERKASVQVLVRGAQFGRANHRLIEEVRQAGIQVLFEAQPILLAGQQGEWRIEVRGHGVIRADMLVASIGRQPDDRLVRQLLPGGYTGTVAQMGLPGLVLAGDLIRDRERYLASAMGDGQRAARIAQETLGCGPGSF